MLLPLLFTCRLTLHGAWCCAMSQGCEGLGASWLTFVWVLLHSGAFLPSNLASGLKKENLHLRLHGWFCAMLCFLLHASEMSINMIQRKSIATLEM